MKIFISLALAFVCIFNLSCDDDVEINSKVTIKDDNGNVFNLDTLPKRIVSLAPNLTECIYAIGADSLLVGVTNYCDYPPQVKQKSKIGGILDPNYEMISSLKPDFVLLTTEGNPKNVYYSLKNYDFKVFVSNPQNINGVCGTIVNLGKLSRKEEKANILSNCILDKKKVFELMNKEVSRKRCLLLVSISPFITVNQFTYINEIIELSGLDNIYKKEINSYPMINYESVLGKNPEYIIISTDTSNTALKNDYMQTISKELNTTDAVKNNNIIFVDENILSRPGPRVIDCIEFIRKKILR
jgi:iron complex transport system substrate-binding protein